MSHADATRDRPWRLAAAALLLALGLAACGDRDAASRRPTDENAPTRARADFAPVPDFQRYMLGDLPQTSAGERDPFGGGPAPTAPVPVTRVAPPPAPSLQGILRADGRLVALFDRGSAGLGESVNGWLVVEIDGRNVVVEREGRRIRRSL